MQNYEKYTIIPYFVRFIPHGMLIFKNQKDLKAHIRVVKNNGNSIGFVPTMGALHKGHTTLLQQAVEDNDVSVCSIFVNPTQFNNSGDYQNYPITTAADIKMLEEVGCAVVYLPSSQDVYPDGAERSPTFDFGYLETILEGKHRPGHFKGVGQVVAILLDVVEPDVLYLGQKDYQQCAVIRNLLHQKGLEHKVTLSIMPTIREDDGLAMSSRNRRLSESQRSLAGVIYQCLVSIVTKRFISTFPVVKKECWELLRNKGFDPEYVALADAKTFELLEEYDNNREMVTLIAARLGDVRLIDNMLIR